MIVPSAIGSLFGLAMIVTFSQVDSAWLKWLLLCLEALAFLIVVMIQVTEAFRPADGAG